jgi:hypothetical protein
MREFTVKRERGPRALTLKKLIAHDAFVLRPFFSDFTCRIECPYQSADSAAGGEGKKQIRIIAAALAQPSQQVEQSRNSRSARTRT